MIQSVRTGFARVVQFRAFCWSLWENLSLFPMDQFPGMAERGIARDMERYEQEHGLTPSRFSQGWLDDDPEG